MRKYFAGFLLLFVAWGFGLTYYIQIRNLLPEDNRIVEVLLVFFAVVLIYRTFDTVRMYVKSRTTSVKDERRIKEKLRSIIYRKEALFIFITLPYIAAIEPLGFFFTSFLYILAANILLGTRSLRKLIFIPIGFTLITYLLFVGLFDIRLPEGILF